MSLRPEDLTLIVRNVTEGMRSSLRDELLREVDGRIEGFRRAVYIGDEWCCVQMRRFAVETWGAAEPRTQDHFGGVAYQIRGRTVNYCPFCGVAFISRKAKQA